MQYKRDGLTFGHFRRKGMAKLMNYLRKGFKGPHRKTAKNGIVRRYFIYKQKLIKHLKLINKIALTTDGWKSNSNNHHLCLTGHFFR